MAVRCPACVIDRVGDSPLGQIDRAETLPDVAEERSIRGVTGEKDARASCHEHESTPEDGRLPGSASGIDESRAVEVIAFIQRHHGGVVKVSRRSERCTCHPLLLRCPH